MSGYLYASLLLLEKRKLNYISILTFYRIYQEGSHKNLLQVQARRKDTYPTLPHQSHESCQRLLARLC